MIHVLSVASEVYPLIKTGGLADVVGALPAALAGHGVAMRVLVPGYPPVMAQVGENRTITGFHELIGGPAQVLATRIGGLDMLVLDAPHLFQREGGPYSDAHGHEFGDNWARFAALSFVAAELCWGRAEGYRPQVLHAHDWQAGLAPAYLRFGPRSTVRSVFTVHNLAFQGQFGPDIFPSLWLPPEAMSITGIEYYGGVGFLKAGLQCADKITTVSQTYADEIRTPDYGMGLQGLIESRADDLQGILNGLDTDVWNPVRDPALKERFAPDRLDNRLANKRAVERHFELAEEDGPLFAVVSRLTWQKGIDILAACLDEIVATGARLCVLGSGEPDLEYAMTSAGARHPGRVGHVNGYNDGLSRLIYGGADAVLVPSRFEPCGLTQLIGLRYGAVPVVARVGGLADTVIDANDAALSAGVATGVQFSPVTPHALLGAVQRALRLFEKRDTWQALQRCGMRSDVSWESRAGQYASLYRELVDGAEQQNGL